MKNECDCNTNTLADISRLCADKYTNKPALSIIGSMPISFYEMDIYVKLAAAKLIEAGIKKGDKIAILSENRPEWGIASLAIATAGAIMVPMTINYSAKHIEKIANHANIKAAFVSDTYRLVWKCKDIKVFSINTLCNLNAELNKVSMAVDFPSVYPSDIASTVYIDDINEALSCVNLSHKNYICDALAYADEAPVQDKDVFLSVLPLPYTYEYTLGFLLPIISGASIWYLNKVPAATVLKKAMPIIRPSIIVSEPIVLEKVYRSLKQSSEENIKKTFGSKLRLLFMMPKALNPALQQFFSKIHFIKQHQYKLTETAPALNTVAMW